MTYEYWNSYRYKMTQQYKVESATNAMKNRDAYKSAIEKRFSLEDVERRMNEYKANKAKGE